MHLSISNRVLAFESRSFQYSLFFGIAIGFYFVYHSYTTFFVKMDYGYNMLINIAFGKDQVLFLLHVLWMVCKS